MSVVEVIRLVFIFSVTIPDLTDQQEIPTQPQVTDTPKSVNTKKKSSKILLKSQYLLKGKCKKILKIYNFRCYTKLNF